jgi:transcriptional regulator with XRE-family HTH domain
MDPKFLKDIQISGWQIVAVTEDGCLAKCGVPGCAVQLFMRQEKAVQVTGATKSGYDFSVSSFDGVREFLRDRREALSLSIKEVEEIAGTTPDLLAKAERDNWAEASTVRQPNVQTFVEWAQALGFEVVLRPTGLPPKALSYIAFTRSRHRARQARTRRLRGGRA